MVPWHVDQSWFETDPLDAFATVWVALEDVDQSNSCLRFIPGSHKLGRILPHDFKVPKSVFLFSIDPESYYAAMGIEGSERAPEGGVCARLRKGEAAIFDGLTINSSLDNLAPGAKRRCGLALRYALATSAETAGARPNVAPMADPKTLTLRHTWAFMQLRMDIGKMQSFMFGPMESGKCSFLCSPTAVRGSQLWRAPRRTRVRLSEVSVDTSVVTKSCESTGFPRRHGDARKASRHGS